MRTKHWVAVGYSLEPREGTQPVASLSVSGGPLVARVGKIAATVGGDLFVTASDDPCVEFMTWLRDELGLDLSQQDMPVLLAVAPGLLTSHLWAESQLSGPLRLRAWPGVFLNSVDPREPFLIGAGPRGLSRYVRRDRLLAVADLPASQTAFHVDAEGDARLVLALALRYNMLPVEQEPVCVLAPSPSGGDVVRRKKA